MATYFIGDLQGCFEEFQRLLKKAQFNPKNDRLFLAGDLVARGENSLECLRFVKNLANSAQTVLGNHDLHLLATHAGLKKPKVKDKVEEILTAPDVDELMNWLRHQPLCISLDKENILLSHAGIAPDWDKKTALRCANEAENVLQSEHYTEFLAQMYAEEPRMWSTSLQGTDRLRYIINAFTRMRFCYRDHSFDFACKLPPKEAPNELLPWYELDNPLYQTTNIIFGHWASLVDEKTPSNIYALDTGCVWGNHLTLLRWEDKEIFTQQKI